MLFICKRVSTSLWEPRTPPCEEAVYDEKLGEWVVTFESLQDLMDFCEKYGNLVISTDDECRNNTVNIYDYYLE